MDERMDNNKIIEKYNLTDAQHAAVIERSKNLIVTAGAGSGKTRTLVTRYLTLLADGLRPREILAITFTEKAASEMKIRVRNEVRELVKTDTTRSDFWKDIENSMNAARIGTIHSFCSEVIHLYPVKAGVDPRSEILDEGLANIEKQKAIRDTLMLAVTDDYYIDLFKLIKVNTLEGLLSYILNKKIDLYDINDKADNIQLLTELISGFLNSAIIIESINTFKQYIDREQLYDDAGEKLGNNIIQLIKYYEEGCEFAHNNKPFDAINSLINMRSTCMDLRPGKKGSIIKACLREMRGYYEESLGPWVSPSRNNGQGVNIEIEKKINEIIQPFNDLKQKAVNIYEKRLREQRFLDFDDLERIALQILDDQEIQNDLQSKIAAVLVDEFQDTNDRQRRIVEALVGHEKGKLFIVGDGRQSIYRFRGADVKVFNQIKKEIVQDGGKALSLNITHRSHKGLIDTIGEILRPIMGTTDDPDKPFHVPYTDLEPARLSADENVKTPFVEIVLGSGDDANEGREIAARALAEHLIDLKNKGEITRWEDVAILFRASTGFRYYEDAFDLYGIPYVTVAGQGFYDRPEIRDFLNLLRALSEPWNDSVMAGLLRSPAFGISDAALYQICSLQKEKKFIKESIYEEQTYLDANDREIVAGVREYFDEIGHFVDRIPVADVIQKILLYTNYKALFVNGQERLYNNLEKLENDARKSKIINTRKYFDYIENLREVGAKEGEAPPDSDGMAQLMTIHKAKGLEYKIVVIADAGRRLKHLAEPLYVIPNGNLTFRTDKLEYDSLLYRWAKWHDEIEQNSEETRLLYVAATRAKDKLIISGHIDEKKSEGYVKWMQEKSVIPFESAQKESGTWHYLSLNDQSQVGVWIGKRHDLQRNVIRMKEEFPIHISESNEKPIFGNLSKTKKVENREQIEEDILVMQRIKTGEVNRMIGKLIHLAIQNGVSPEKESFTKVYSLLKGSLFRPDNEKDNIIEQAVLLGKRLYNHPVWNDINSAVQKYHELPYQVLKENRTDQGIIDLLYLNNDQWIIIDFKSDSISNELFLDKRVNQYREQMMRYHYAVSKLMGISPLLKLCFLDVSGSIKIVDVKL